MIDCNTNNVLLQKITISSSDNSDFNPRSANFKVNNLASAVTKKTTNKHVFTMWPHIVLKFNTIVGTDIITERLFTLMNHINYDNICRFVKLDSSAFFNLIILSSYELESFKAFFFCVENCFA